MVRGMRVFTGVPVRRAIATKRHAAFLTRAQMNPVGTDLHALLTFAVLRLFDGRHRIEMRAASASHLFLFVLLCVL